MSIEVTAVLTFTIPMTDPELVAAYGTVDPAAVAAMELANLNIGDYLPALIASDMLTADRYEVTVSNAAGETATATTELDTTTGEPS
jgi:hypothetical protein